MTTIYDSAPLRLVKAMLGETDVEKTILNLLDECDFLHARRPAHHRGVFGSAQAKDLLLEATLLKTKRLYALAQKTIARDELAMLFNKPCLTADLKQLLDVVSFEFGTVDPFAKLSDDQLMDTIVVVALVLHSFTAENNDLASSVLDVLHILALTRTIRIAERRESEDVLRS
jgi:hypothetical protein